MRNGQEIDFFLQKKLNERIEAHSLRQLPVELSLIDFCSNDYLGFAKSNELTLKANSLSTNLSSKNGATGSRLISGNSSLYESIEQSIAKFHKAEAGLIFNSGYDANIGLFSCIAERSDTIIYDQLCHASIRDGIRLSTSRSFAFKHNDLHDLENKLKQASGNIFIAVESVYSMDGDLAPLNDIVAITNKYNAKLIVDEAHGTGVFGKNGAGLVNELSLETEILARVHTFGKSLGTHGAIILGSNTLRLYLINFARSFIYTTALPPHSLMSIKASYDLLTTTNHQQLLIDNIHYFRSLLAEKTKRHFIESNSPIQCLIIPDNKRVKQMAERMQKEGFNVKAILHPTVPKGQERIRICLHAFNKKTDIAKLCSLINENLIMLL